MHKQKSTNTKELKRLSKLGNAAIRSIKAGICTHGGKIAKVRKKNINRSGMFQVMEELGFTNKSANGITFIHKQDKYVFKLPYLVGRKTPHLSIPTWSKKTNTFGVVFVQPLADTSKKARNIFVKTTRWTAQRRFKEASDRTDDVLTKTGRKYLGVDCHDGNFGIYKGEPVVFDW